MTSEIPFLNERLAEAARYALMRRLLPALRHNIAGSLQPVSMMAAMLERRLQSAAPNLVQLGDNSRALNILSREALTTSLNLMNWLAPGDSALVPVHCVVEECLAMIATELSFRGFSVINQTSDIQSSVPRGNFRSVFTASLIALTDAVEDAANVVVSAKLMGGQTHLKMILEPAVKTELADMAVRAQTYRNLDWGDVQALADAERVNMSHDGICAQMIFCRSPD